MNKQEVIDRLKMLEEPWKMDPYIPDPFERDGYDGMDYLIQYIKALREELEEDLKSYDIQLYKK